MLAACEIHETSPRFPPSVEHTDTSWSKSRVTIAATALPAAITQKMARQSDDSSDKAETCVANENQPRLQ
jgi:hypothetical protein